jgi:NAD(P)H-dependent FMN reductase
MSTRILASVGSLRAGSYNRQLAEAAVKLAPEGVEVEIYEGLAGVPLYKEDLDEPATARTVPAALKNAIDWTSRPQLRGAIFEKPLAVIGSSGYPSRVRRGNHRQDAHHPGLSRRRGAD